MESHNIPSLIPTASTLQSHRYPTSHQNTSTTYQRSDATRSNTNHASQIRFDLPKSGTAPCEETTVEARIRCFQRLDGIYFSGEVVAGRRVALSDVQSFCEALEDTVNASTVLADSAIQASTKPPSQGTSIQDATLASAVKVARALGENHNKATNGSFGAHPSAQYVAIGADDALDKILPGTGTRRETAGTHRLQQKAHTDRTFDGLADPTVGPSHVDIPVWWMNPSGVEIIDDAILPLRYAYTQH